MSSKFKNAAPIHWLQEWCRLVLGEEDIDPFSSEDTINVTLVSSYSKTGVRFDCNVQQRLRHSGTPGRWFGRVFVPGEEDPWNVTVDVFTQTNQLRVFLSRNKSGQAVVADSGLVAFVHQPVLNSALVPLAPSGGFGRIGVLVTH